MTWNHPKGSAGSGLRNIIFARVTDRSKNSDIYAEYSASTKNVHTVIADSSILKIKCVLINTAFIITQSVHTFFGATLYIREEAGGWHSAPAQGVWGGGGDIQWLALKSVSL